MSTRNDVKTAPRGKKESQEKAAARLHRRAKAGLNGRFRGRKNVSATHLPRLVHELEPRQIELEIQDEELRRSQEELVQSRRKYQHLFEFSPVGYFIFNSEGLISEVNIAGAWMLGVSKSSLINKPFRALVRSRERDLFSGHLKEVFRSGAVQSCEVALRRRDGSILWVNLRSIPSQEAPDRYCHTSMSDITGHKAQEEELDRYRHHLEKLVLERTSELEESNRELRDKIAELGIAREALGRSEQLFRSLIENSSDIVLLVDKGGTLLYVSDSVKRVLGMKPGELFARNAIDFVHPEDRDHVAKSIAGMKVRGIRTQIFRVRHKDGSWHFVEGLAKRLGGPAGEVIINARDVTERRRMERRLRKLVLHLERVREEERVRISREIHDNLGQMLTALFLELARLRSRHLAAVPSGVRETMDNMSRMLDETTDSVHRICADLRPSVLDNLGLKEAIRWQVGEFGKRAHVRTVIHMPRGQLRLAEDVSTDLFRILQEALTNVVRHARATEVRVRLKMDEKVVKLVVRDNGIGITRKNLLGSSTFGIMGMQERVAGLGGEVTVRGIHGRGTTVAVSIPAAVEGSGK